MRIALGIEYNGDKFHGWQFQKGLPTIEGALQEALAHIADEEVFLTCAGRTDRGVHAYGQVVHFDTKAKRHIDAWIFGCNRFLPPDIGVRWSKMVDYHFHARYSATARRYCYIIYNHPIRPAIFSKRMTWIYYPLDVARMRIAAQALLGEQDFSSFRSAQCAAKTAMRHITEIAIKRVDDYIFIEIEANAFLQHMVRNIAGVLLRIGSGACEPDWIHEVIAAKDRRAAGETAAPDGLYLVKVNYLTGYNFPEMKPLFLFSPNV
jgi:tRNA pseudouridine38-40 synthase